MVLPRVGCMGWPNWQKQIYDWRMVEVVGGEIYMVVILVDLEEWVEVVVGTTTINSDLTMSEKVGYFSWGPSHPQSARNFFQQSSTQTELNVY